MASAFRKPSTHVGDRDRHADQRFDGEQGGLWGPGGAWLCFKGRISGQGKPPEEEQRQRGGAGLGRPSQEGWHMEPEACSGPVCPGWSEVWSLGQRGHQGLTGRPFQPC